MRWTTRAEAHATTTEHQLGDHAEAVLLLCGDQPTGWMSNERALRREFVWATGGRAGMPGLRVSVKNNE